MHRTTNNVTYTTKYSYDGRGKRAVKVAVGASGNNRTYLIYSGKSLIGEFSDVSTATYNSGTTPQQAPSDSVALLLYQHSDHMHVRVTTDNFGNIATERGDYPYGDEWYETGAAMASVARKFHRYRIEPELPNSVLNASLAREHSARLGRFHTPDVRSGSVLVPQRMNRYSYSSDDPINRWDPEGTWDGVCTDDCDEGPIQCLVPDCGPGAPDGGGGGGDPGDDPPVAVQPPDPPCTGNDSGCNPPPAPCDPSQTNCNPQPCDPNTPGCTQPPCDPTTNADCNPPQDPPTDPPQQCDPSTDPMCNQPCDPNPSPLQIQQCKQNNCLVPCIAAFACLLLPPPEDAWCFFSVGAACLQCYQRCEHPCGPST